MSRHYLFVSAFSFLSYKLSWLKARPYNWILKTAEHMPTQFTDVLRDQIVKYKLKIWRFNFVTLK